MIQWCDHQFNKDCILGNLCLVIEQLTTGTLFLITVLIALHYIALKHTFVCTELKTRSYMARLCLLMRSTRFNISEFVE